MWEVEHTDEFEDWWVGLQESEQNYLDAAVEKLEEFGPNLGRPLVDTIEDSRHPNMKELRPPGGNIRVLFVFNPVRSAILLVGGDKTGRWKKWYQETIPVADDLYDVHLEELRREGQIT